MTRAAFSETSARAVGASTELCAVILHPAAHTRSPAMHNAAFAALGLDAAYAAFDVPPASLATTLEAARNLGIRQLAVSLPHKEAVLPLLDEIDSVAAAIGAVNTITRREGALRGTNTDWIGAVRALERKTTLAGRDAVILGAGGTARAVLYGLLERGARVRVLNRTPAKAEALVSALGGEGSGPLEALADTPHALLVNTTRVGLGEDRSPVAADAISPTCTVLDAVYQPAETRLLRDAAARGAHTVGGKWMLVYQAAAQLETWSGREAPIEVMAEAFDRAG